MELEHDTWDTENEPELPINFLIRAFENPLTTFASSYSDAQIDQGLYFLIDNMSSKHVSALRDDRVPLPLRVRALQAMSVVFEKVFLPRCSGNLIHLDEHKNLDNPLDAVCYMWWDILLIHTLSSWPNPMPATILQVIEKILELNSDSCRESALHGFSHWKQYDPQSVENIMDKFLDEHKEIRPELAVYAQRVRKI